MTYKDILTKINTDIDEIKRKDARAYILSEKKKGTDLETVWAACLNIYGSKPGPTDQEPERVKGEVLTGAFNGLTMSDIENKIYMCLEDFKTENNIQDDTELRKAPQSTWMAFCIYNGNHVFRKTKLLKDNTKVDNGSCLNTTNNKYDIDKVISVLHFYEFLCHKYNKIFNDWSACAFIGANDRFLADHREELTTRGIDTHKKNEQFLTDSLTGSNKNPTGVICALNHLHGWANSEQRTTPQQVNVSVYPVLTTTGQRNIENKGNYS